MKGKNIITALLIFIMIMSFGTLAFADTGSTQGQSGFKDVGNNYNWAKEAIEYFSRHGIVNGTGDGYFNPQDYITREQFAKILVLTFNEPLSNDRTADTFADIPANRWSYPYIEAVKYYLTGYYPPNGKPIFDPTGNATREDIAVALVKMMGYSEQDLSNQSILEEKFTDADDVSPNIKQLVAVAVEKGLMKGSDGLLRPNDPLTRAESVVLLYRAMKYSVDDVSKPLKLEAQIPDYVSTRMVYITGITEPGAWVSINGQAVNVDENGRFKSDYMLKSEGTFTFVIEAYKDKRYAKIQKNIVYAVGAPELYVNDIPENTNISSVVITGSVWDAGDKHPRVYVNGSAAEIKDDGNWTASASLNEGVNTITIKAVNSSGKTTVVTKNITFTAGAPGLDITYCPETTDVSPVSVSGFVYDSYDLIPKVYINDKEMSVGAQGVWSGQVNLKEGKNILNITAVNSMGKKTVIVREITFAPQTPILTITSCPETTNVDLVTIAGTVLDNNDPRPRLFINGSEKHVNSDGSWAATVKLIAGTNNVKIEAVNKLSKSTVVTKAIILKY